jgi:hypothetical protein
MRLFNQLTHQEQDLVVNYNVSILLDQFVSGEFQFDTCENDCEHKSAFKEALTHIKTIEKEADKISYLLDDEETYDMILDMAIESSKNVFYMDEDDNVIYPHLLQADEDAAHMDDVAAEVVPGEPVETKDESAPVQEPKPRKNFNVN